MLGCPSHELVGRRCDEFVDPVDAAAVTTAYLEAMDTRDTVHLLHGARDASSRPVTVARALRAVRDPTGGDVEEVHSLIRLRN